MNQRIGQEQDVPETPPACRYRDPAVVGDDPDGRGRLVVDLALDDGDAATVVTWSAAVPAAARAAELLAGDGIAVDLLDLRTIWPWDEEAVAAGSRADASGFPEPW